MLLDEPNQAILRMQKIAAQYNVDALWLSNPNTQVEFVDTVLGNMVLRLTSEVYRQDLPPEQISVPQAVDYITWESAWQLWKHNHSSNRLLGVFNKLWPAKYVVKTEHITVSVQLEKYVTYPEAFRSLGTDVPGYTLKVV